MKKIIDAKIADDANPSELLSPYEISTLRTLRTSDEDCDALNTKLETLVRLIIKQSEKDGTLPNWADHPVITADGKFDVRLIIDWMLGKKNDNQNSPEITTDLSRVPGSVTTRLENDYDGDEK
ncbi:MAG: hypothetical protein H6766_06635 [Candidatus Peribacteria bacterium]|nr:MAG: hypothetical protein H6766_06635 [Candidatus Peribacteria bacterium]